VHAWIGLKLSLCLFVILFSGTLAVVGNEIDWLADPAMRADPAAGARASWGTIAANARTAVPGGRIDLMERGPDPWFATVVVMQAPDGHRRRVLVDPVTGAVNRVAPFGGAQRFLRDFHRRFMLPVAIGLPIVTAFGLLMGISLVTGLVTYKKFWRGFFRRPRGGDLRTTVGDMHRLGGLWSIWFVLLIVATSIWYLVELLGGAASPMLPLEPVAKGAKPVLAQPAGADLDRLYAKARTAYPGLETTRVLFPFSGMHMIGFQGQAGTMLTTEKANAVFVDPADGAVKMRVVGEALDAHARISEMADPIHFGTWGGLATKLVWFVFGLFLTGLSLTGTMIYATRLHGGVAAYVRGVSVWLAPSAALILVAFWFAPRVLAG
jgi:uncharacterized iron-regulated membrane protein